MMIERENVVPALVYDDMNSWEIVDEIKHGEVAVVIETVPTKALLFMKVVTPRGVVGYVGNSNHYLWKEIC